MPIGYLISHMTLNHFVTTANGSIDFGYISAEIATKLGVKSAPIRLRDGGVEPGTGHIERKERLQQLKEAGYESAAVLVFDVGQNFNCIFQGKGNSLMLAKRNGKALIAFVELEVSSDELYYDTRSALVARADYLKNKKLLWERAQSNQFLAEPSSAVSSQSSKIDSMSKINLIWAQAHNRVIGKDGVMPWHLPEDLAHFKRTTLGHPVIMGRKTWDSLPTRFRPLPGRMNIVITRSSDFLAGQETSALRVATSLESALALASQHSEVWVIGGAQIYAQALPLASTVVVTHIDASFEGDAFAPELGQEWNETKSESMVANNGLRLAFVQLNRITTKS
jgi:dihydrofolate reductase